MKTGIYFLFFFGVLISHTSLAQLGGTHDFLDTAYIPGKRMNQQSEFLGNKHGFPAKPRDMWQIGIFTGFPYVDGDCATALKGAGNDISSLAGGIGVSIRKSMGYALSIRASASYYNMLGLDYQRNGNVNNSPVIQNYYYPDPGAYIHNYRTMAFASSLEAIISLNNIMFHSKQSRWNLYIMAGYTALFYKTTMDVIGSDGQRYNVRSISISGRAREDIRKDLRSMFDGIYETNAETNDRRAGYKDFHLRHCFTSGGGFEYRVGKKWSMGVEYKRIQPRDDYIDGYFRQSGDLENPTFTSEFDNIAFISLGANFNVGNSKKRTPPLWWLNPLEFSYSELNSPRHMKVKVSLDDGDGDGVTDQFDLEPNTPVGCPVDTHGVTRDTDGDGVPDCKDKEMLTQQTCFPVDADGIGNCPDPPCCDEKGRGGGDNGRDTTVNLDPNKGQCKIGSLPGIQFKNNSYHISSDAEAVLAGAAAMIRANTNCNIRVIGYAASNKFSQQNSWERVNAVIRYLVDKQGIPEDRFIFNYGDPNGDSNTVDLEGTMDEGPSVVPAPHPNLRKKR